MKFLSLLAAAGIALTVNTSDVSANEVLAGKALEKRLTNTMLTLRPVGRKLRKGEATRDKIKLLPTGTSTWETNGQYPRESLFHWRVRGNLICFENANQRFYDKRRRDRGQKVRKRGKYDNCSVLGLKGNLVTMYAPQGSFNKDWALTGRIKSIWT
jgi:hypothetical protein